MSRPDFAELFQTLMSNDLFFYGLVGIVVLFAVFLAWRLVGTGRADDEGEERPKEKAAETADRLVDRVIEQGTDGAEPTERVDEPIITGRQDYPPEEEEEEEEDDLPPSVPTDTVEVLRHLSSDAEERYEVRPVGAKPEKPAAAPQPAAAPKPAPAPKPVQEPERQVSLEEGLAKTKGGFVSRLNTMVFGRKKIDDSVFEQLEEILYSADIGPTATRLFDTVAEQCKRKELKDPARIRELLRDEILRTLNTAQRPVDLDAGPTPKVILMVGVNGVGKTTTIGKLAKTYHDAGKRVMLAAGDTFRAAAVEQLAIWGERAGVEVITAKEGANPSGVIFSAVEAAKARGVDVLIADTAGRLHTKFNLMEELRKMKAVAAKALGREPDEVWLVIDANTGQNAVVQAQKFHESLGLTGLILTKLDGTAKGGVVIGITDQLGLPIRYIGIGEGVRDLRPFDAAAFVEALF